MEISSALVDAATASNLEWLPKESLSNVSTNNESDKYSLTVDLHGSSVNISRSLSINFLLVVGHRHLSPGWDFEMRSHGSATIL